MKVHYLNFCCIEITYTMLADDKRGWSFCGGFSDLCCYRTNHKITKLQRDETKSEKPHYILFCHTPRVHKRPYCSFYMQKFLILPKKIFISFAHDKIKICVFGFIFVFEYCVSFLDIFN